MVKIIHVVENLDKGAVENWLVRTFIESKKIRPDWKWTFYCILGKKGRLDEQVKAEGGEIIYSPYWISEKYKFLRHLRRTLKSGRYDIIHSHHDYLSGFYLLATAGLQFKKRILHIHNTDKALPVGNAYLHRLLLPLFKKSAVYFSDLVVGISKNTLSEFIGKSGIRKSTAILYYGVDLMPYKPIAETSDSFYKDLAIPEKAKTLLFVGRLNTLKNPGFVVDVLAVLEKSNENVYAIFIGQGDEQLILKKANEYNLVHKIRMLGWRNDTAAIMKMADIFIFPRIEYPKEGLGLVVVEAQAAGLTMMLSRGIVEDVIEIVEINNMLPLDEGAEIWASKIENLFSQQRVISRSQCYDRMAASKFGLGRATKNLLVLYE